MPTLDGDEIFDLGFWKFAWFGMVKNSARNCALTRSVMPGSDGLKVTENGCPVRSVVMPARFHQPTSLPAKPLC